MDLVENKQQLYEYLITKEKFNGIIYNNENKATIISSVLHYIVFKKNNMFV